MAPPLLVQLDSAPAGEVRLDAAKLGFVRSTPLDAARAIASRKAEVVVCGRFAGWQALVSRIDAAGGAAVLWGPPPTAGESGPLGGIAVRHCEELERLPAFTAEVASEISARRATRADDAAGDARRVGRFAQLIAAQIDLPNVVEEAIARTRDLCDADGASLLLVDPETGELCFEVVSGGSALVSRFRLRPGQGVAGRVAQSARAMLVADVASSSAFHSACDLQSGFKTGSIVCVPLLLSGDVIGVLEAVRKDGAAPFEDAHLDRLEQLAPHVAIAVHNAQVSARLRESQAKLVEANSRLEEKVRVRTAQIAKGKREWEQTFDAIRAPIALLDGFTVRRANQAWADQAGVPIAEVPGKTCHRLLAGRDTPCPGCPLAQGKESDEVAFPSGARFHASAFQLDAGSSAGVVVHYRDVTRERQMESKLREQERMVALGKLADGASHEINNPLAFIQANLVNLRQRAADLIALSSAAEEARKLARTGRKDAALAQLLQAAEVFTPLDAEETRDVVEESLHGAQRVKRIVAGLRELSRQELGRPVPCEVNATATRIAEAELAEHPVSLSLELKATQAALISPLPLSQALSAIVRNARQAVHPGKRVSVRTADEHGFVRFEIEDEGCGISEEHLHRIFEPFFTTRPTGEGIGLGLTAAYGVISRFGGAIDVRSVEGRGTTVTVRLPAAAAESTSSEALSATP